MDFFFFGYNILWTLSLQITLLFSPADIYMKQLIDWAFVTANSAVYHLCELFSLVFYAFIFGLNPAGSFMCAVFSL